MKTLILLLATILPSFAADVPLQWDVPDSGPASVKSYVITEKLAAGNRVVATVAAPLLEFKLTGVTQGPHTYFVTAVSPEGIVSDASNELAITAPGPAKNLRIKVTMLEGEDGNNFTLAQVAPMVFTIPAGQRRAFYKGEIEFSE